MNTDKRKVEGKGQAEDDSAFLSSIRVHLRSSVASSQSCFSDHSGNLLFTAPLG
jgi:hypothetical protein